ncbi:LuxR C-terminal-related transcriptional regulator [Orbus sturtevantii]|uniref:helix-turn-helix transcriptional regulator n=1 Tax=Orbus sturtevantii TaxID=3074109 RepID=UPI00370DD855
MLEKLTKREKDVYELIKKGLNCKKISEKFGISICTTLKHKTNIFHKLNIHNELQLKCYLLPEKNLKKK